jgi:sterol desaturase/sphingolipid hydroxylase (fatty acid hydroxylase superfamily)
VTIWSAELPVGGSPGAVAARARSLLGRLYLPSFAILAATAAVVWVAVARLEGRGELAAVLGAGRAELIAPLLVLLVVLAVVCERVWPAEPQPVLARGHVQDACFVVVYAALVVPLMTLLGVGFAALVGAHARWLEVGWTAHWPGWLLVGVTVIAMDGANWVAHYADHRLAPLWRLHAVHHSQEELSVLTSFRAHPLMHTSGFLLATVPVMALMGDRPIAPILITTYVCLGTLPHANVRWRLGPVGRVVVSPSYHRLHHAAEGTQGVNLAVVLTVWDVLAGRARFPAADEPVCRTGIAGRPVAVEQVGAKARPMRTLLRQLTGPFVATPE